MSSVTGERIKSSNAGSCWNLGISEAGCRLSIEGVIAGMGEAKLEEADEADNERCILTLSVRVDMMSMQDKT